MPKPLGYAGPITAAIAPVGSQNAGNWTANFTPQIIGISQPTFDCYHIVIDDGPIGFKFRVFVGSAPWDTVFPGWDTSWDPNQVMELINGQTVSFQWNTGTGTAPKVTMHFRESSPL